MAPSKIQVFATSISGRAHRTLLSSSEPSLIFSLCLSVRHRVTENNLKWHLYLLNNLLGNPENFFWMFFLGWVIIWSCLVHWFFDIECPISLDHLSWASIWSRAQRTRQEIIHIVSVWEFNASSLTNTQPKYPVEIYNVSVFFPQIQQRIEDR